LQGTGIAYHESLVTLFGLLDLCLQEVPDWNCCGATSYMSIDEARPSRFRHGTWHWRIKRYADLLAPCSACYCVAEDAGLLRKIRADRPAGEGVAACGGTAGDRFRAGTPSARSAVHGHRTERIRSLVKRHWHGGQVACYYGCQLVRPYVEADRSHDPRRMDELLQAAGVPTIEYALKTKCCGDR
jgi:heterodisulfide reductase subunit B